MPSNTVNAINGSDTISAVNSLSTVSRLSKISSEMKILYCPRENTAMAAVSRLSVQNSLNSHLGSSVNNEPMANKASAPHTEAAMPAQSRFAQPFKMKI